MTERGIPFNNYEIDEPYDYWDRGSRADEYRFSCIVTPGKKPEIDETVDVPQTGIRYRY